MVFLDRSPDPDTSKRPLFAFILGTLAVGLIGSLITRPAIEGWYHTLNRPEYAPPDWVFAPVWTALYVLMAVAAWRVWKMTGTRSKEMKLYAAQLVLNLGWSVIFFGLHRVEWAFFEILALFLVVFATAKAFHKKDQLAGYMMLAYVAWTGFAMSLNYGFMVLNPGQ